MAQSKTTRPVKRIAAIRPATTQDKIAQALKLASSQAKNSSQRRD